MSDPAPKRRRVELSLVDKIKLIQDSESLPKPTLKTLSKTFGVGKSTVSDILKIAIKKTMKRTEMGRNAV